MDLPVIFLMGPTAAGKTGLAVDLAQRLSLEIVSVDSAMVYRGLDIGTAKPSPEILRIAPHHLIDICDPSEVYSAARFRDDAMCCIQQIHGRGKVPLLTGGTGLYFRALEQGLSELPSGDAGMRKRLEAEAENLGWEAMHARLSEVDPEAAGKIHAHDPQRIQRALEVYLLTGRPITAHYREVLKQRLPWRVIKIIITPSDRGRLHQQADQRFLTGVAVPTGDDHAGTVLGEPACRAKADAHRPAGNDHDLAAQFIAHCQFTSPVWPGARPGA